MGLHEMELESNVSNGNAFVMELPEPYLKYFF